MFDSLFDSERITNQSFYSGNEDLLVFLHLSLCIMIRVHWLIYKIYFNEGRAISCCCILFYSVGFSLRSHKLVILNSRK